MLAPAVAPTATAATTISIRSSSISRCLLPPPPDCGSPEARADEQQVARGRRGAQPGAAARGARSVGAQRLFLRAVGRPGFCAGAPSVDRALLRARAAPTFERLIDRGEGVLGAAASRRRAEERGSYPSGHAAFAASTRDRARRSCCRRNATRSSRRRASSPRTASSWGCTIRATSRRAGRPGRWPPTS